MTNDAHGKPETMAEQMAKFQGFAVKDGETFDGSSKSPADEQAEAEAAERTAQQVNGRSHAENQRDGTTTNQPGKGAEGTAAKVELSADEEQNALQEATDKKGAVLTDEEADAVVAKALAAKEKAAKKPQPNPERARQAFERREARRRDNLVRENEDLRRRLDALERGEKPAALTNDTKTDKTVSKDAKPDHTNAEKYKYGELDPQYLADLSAWAAREAVRQDKEGEKTQQQSQREAEAMAAFQEAKAAFEEAGMAQFDDFEDVVIATTDLKETDPGYWPLSAAMAELILESDHGPAIAYELASNPKEARRIFQLSAARQAAWFGVKESELSAGSAKSAKGQDEDESPPQAEARTKRQLPQPRTGQARESKAPVPPTKLNGTGGNRVPSEATTDFAQFEALAKGKLK